MNRARLAVLGVSMMLLTGCVALPFATPPIEYSGGVGLAVQNDGPRFALPVRGIIYPAGLVDDFYERSWDVGVGYQLLLPVSGEFLHGPQASVGWLQPYPIESDEGRSMWRIGVHGMPGLAFDAYDGELGYSLTARVTGEYVGWAEGPFGECGSADGCVFGWAYGETSAGLYAEASYWAADPRIWTVSAGILVRAPAMVGVIFAWILN